MLFEIIDFSIPNTLPEGMQKAVEEVKSSNSKKEAVKKAYFILTNRFHGGHVATYTRLYRLFEENLDHIWLRQGYLHCTVLNHLLKILLVKSGWFCESEVRVRWTSVWIISPHEYAQVLINNKWVDVDIWSCFEKIPFGKHAHGFV